MVMFFFPLSVSLCQRIMNQLDHVFFVNPELAPRHGLHWGECDPTEEERRWQVSTEVFRQKIFCGGRKTMAHLEKQRIAPAQA